MIFHCIVVNLPGDTLLEKSVSFLSQQPAIGNISIGLDGTLSTSHPVHAGVWSGLGSHMSLAHCHICYEFMSEAALVCPEVSLCL